MGNQIKDKNLMILKCHIIWVLNDIFKSESHRKKTLPTKSRKSLRQAYSFLNCAELNILQMIFWIIKKYFLSICQEPDIKDTASCKETKSFTLVRIAFWEKFTAHK